MNVKRFLMASLAVFVVGVVFEYLVHNVALMPVYRALKDVWRPDMEALTWIMYPVGLVCSLLFVYIFIKGYEGKGVIEGLRFGLFLGAYVSVGMAFGSYIMLKIPLSLAIQWLIAGVLELMLQGAAAAAIYKPAGAFVRRVA
jgi:hypothetical protein